MSDINLKLTAKQAKALATFLETGLSIYPIIKKGDPDFQPMCQIDTKLRAALKS